MTQSKDHTSPHSESDDETYAVFGLLYNDDYTRHTVWMTKARANVFRTMLQNSKSNDDVVSWHIFQRVS